MRATPPLGSINTWKKRHWYLLALAVAGCAGEVRKSSEATQGSGGTRAIDGDAMVSSATGARSGSVTSGSTTTGGTTIGTATTGFGGTGPIEGTTTTSITSSGDSTSSTTSASAGAAGAPTSDVDLDVALESCRGTVCHGHPDMESAVTLGAGLDLFRPDRDQWLIDRSATYVGVTNPEDCADPPELYVDTSSPNDSLIIKKLEGRQSCGETAPFGLPISDEAVQRIKDWVLELAMGD